MGGIPPPDLEAQLGDIQEIWRNSKPLMEFVKTNREQWLELRQRLGMTVISTDTFNRFQVKGYIDEWSGRDCCLIYPRYR